MGRAGQPVEIRDQRMILGRAWRPGPDGPSCGDRARPAGPIPRASSGQSAFVPAGHQRLELLPVRLVSRYEVTHTSLAGTLARDSVMQSANRFRNAGKCPHQLRDRRAGNAFPRLVDRQHPIWRADLVIGLGLIWIGLSLLVNDSAFMAWFDSILLGILIFLISIGWYCLFRRLRTAASGRLSVSGEPASGWCGRTGFRSIGCGDFFAPPCFGSSITCRRCGSCR